jgi:hypothetical protein
VNKTRTDIAITGIKLNAQVMIRNLEGMHEKSPFRPREREGGCQWTRSASITEDWARRPGGELITLPVVHTVDEA